MSRVARPRRIIQPERGDVATRKCYDAASGGAARGMPTDDIRRDRIRPDRPIATLAYDLMLGAVLGDRSLWDDALEVLRNGPHGGRETAFGLHLSAYHTVCARIASPAGNPVSVEQRDCLRKEPLAVVPPHGKADRRIESHAVLRGSIVGWVSGALCPASTRGGGPVCADPGWACGQARS